MQESYPKTILEVSPHPDDESIGSPATLMMLREAGHRVINMACSLGRPADHARRKAELETACERAGYELVVADPPAQISGGDDLAYAQDYLSDTIMGLQQDYHADVVVSPSVHDAHHGHEVVGRAVRDALDKTAEGTAWWMWNIWGDLPFPTLYTPLDESRLNTVMHALDAYTGENARNDYRNMVLGRAKLNTVLGSEKIFGFGAEAACPSQPYAELLTEVIKRDGEWMEGTKRILDPSNPLDKNVSQISLQWWIDSPSPYQTYRDRTQDKR